MFPMSPPSRRANDGEVGRERPHESLKVTVARGVGSRRYQLAGGSSLQTKAEIHLASVTPESCGAVCAVVASQHVSASSQWHEPSPATASCDSKLHLFRTKPSWGLATARERINWANLFSFSNIKSLNLGVAGPVASCLCAFCF